MKVLLIVAMAFIVPLAGIAVFILIDKALDKLLSRLKNKGRNSRYANLDLSPRADVKPNPQSGARLIPVSSANSSPGLSAQPGGATTPTAAVEPTLRVLPSEQSADADGPGKKRGCQRCAAGCRAAAAAACARRRQA